MQISLKFVCCIMQTSLKFVCCIMQISLKIVCCIMQISLKIDCADSYVFADNIEYPSGNRLPLWLLGFLY